MSFVTAPPNPFAKYSCKVDKRMNTEPLDVSQIISEPVMIELITTHVPKRKRDDDDDGTQVILKKLKRMPPELKMAPTPAEYAAISDAFHKTFDSELTSHVYNTVMATCKSQAKAKGKEWYQGVPLPLTFFNIESTESCFEPYTYSGTIEDNVEAMIDFSNAGMFYEWFVHRGVTVGTYKRGVTCRDAFMEAYDAFEFDMVKNPHIAWSIEMTIAICFGQRLNTDDEPCPILTPRTMDQAPENAGLFRKVVQETLKNRMHFAGVYATIFYKGMKTLCALSPVKIKECISTFLILWCFYWPLFSEFVGYTADAISMQCEDFRETVGEGDKKQIFKEHMQKLPWVAWGIRSLALLYASKK